MKICTSISVWSGESRGQRAAERAGGAFPRTMAGGSHASGYGALVLPVDGGTNRREPETSEHSFGGEL
jgi:hypothetical protein